jgi:hypothetical protein
MDKIEQKFNELCIIPSDINEHLPTLSKYASECESVLELGVRGCISSWALVNGLLKNNKIKKNILLNDLSKCEIDELLYCCADYNTNVNIKYQWCNDLTLELKENVDLTFIDTWHVYGQLKRELNKFSKVTNKYIIMHDTTVDEIYGESLRCGSNINEQSIVSGFPINEITCGLWKAVEEFLAANSNWFIYERSFNNNGLTVLKRMS